MPRPKSGYQTKDGEKVPGVTSVIGRFKDSGGLLWWAWNEGKEGRDYRQTRDRAADAGTLAHALVNAHIRGEDWEALLSGAAPDIAVRALAGYTAFRQWLKQTNAVITVAEEPLVSELYGFGGTPDALLQIDGKRYMGDFKASNAVYPDYALQGAAYQQLWNEVHPDRPVESGYHLLRFGREGGDFSHHHWGDLIPAWEMFLSLLKAYALDKVVKARYK